MYTKEQIALAKQLLNEIEEEANIGDILDSPSNIAIRIQGRIIQKLKEIINNGGEK